MRIFICLLVVLLSGCSSSSVRRLDDKVQQEKLSAQVEEHRLSQARDKLSRQKVAAEECSVRSRHQRVCQRAEQCSSNYSRAVDSAQLGRSAAVE